MRKMTEEDLRHKGLPFVCNNCGAKPTTVKGSSITWKSVKECLPEMTLSDIGNLRSKNVLIRCDGDIRIGYVSQWDEEEPKWLLAGRDSYGAENTTHWRYMDDLYLAAMKGDENASL